MSSGRQIAKNAAIVSFFTTMSRVLGIVRDIIMANLFGTTLASSAFTLAWQLPNLFRAVLGEGALSAAFIPVLAGTREKDGESEADKVASSIMIMLGGFLMLLVGLGVLLLLFLGRLDLGAKWNATVSLSTITLPYVFFICMAALCMGVFHARRRFLVPAVSQSLLNIVWIGVLLKMCPRFGDTPMEQIYAVAWGVLAAGLAQLAFQSFFLWRMGFRFRLNARLRTPQVTRFLKLMTPVFIGSGVTQLNILVGGFLAMAAGAWAPAAFGFSSRLVYAALGIFGTALGTVLLPEFSIQAASKRHDDLMTTLGRSIRVIALIMTPVAALLSALALPCVTLIFQRGEFDYRSAVLVSRALMVMAPGLVVFSINKVVVPAFYGMQNTDTPVRVALCGTGIGFVLNILSVTLLPEGFQQVGLAGSVVLSSLFSALVLLVLLQKKMGGRQLSKAGWSVISTLMTGAIMAVVCVRTHNSITKSAWYAESSGSEIYQALAIGGAAAVGLAVYLAGRIMVNRDETMRAIKVMAKLRKR